MAPGGNKELAHGGPVLLYIPMAICTRAFPNTYFYSSLLLYPAALSSAQAFPDPYFYSFLLLYPAALSLPITTFCSPLLPWQSPSGGIARSEWLIHLVFIIFLVSPTSKNKILLEAFFSVLFCRGAHEWYRFPSFCVMILVQYGFV